jgi:hypothetical protein
VDDRRHESRQRVVGSRGEGIRAGNTGSATNRVKPSPLRNGRDREVERVLARASVAARGQDARSKPSSPRWARAARSARGSTRLAPRREPVSPGSAIRYPRSPRHGSACAPPASRGTRGSH